MSEDQFQMLLDEFHYFQGQLKALTALLTIQVLMTGGTKKALSAELTKVYHELDEGSQKRLAFRESFNPYLNIPSQPPRLD